MDPPTDPVGQARNDVKADGEEDDEGDEESFCPLAHPLLMVGRLGLTPLFLLSF